MNLNQINDYLVKEGYIIIIRDKPILSNKYFRDLVLKKSNINLPVVQDIRVVKQEEKKLTTQVAKSLFKQFAEDAHVPFRVEDGNGREYTVKTYSEPGTKAFMRVMERVKLGEIDYHILTASTRLYYGKGTYKKTLSNYFIDEVWEGEYLEFKKKHESGKLEQHIKKGLDESGSNMKIR